jgi:hypothetical protein
MSVFESGVLPRLPEPAPELQKQLTTPFACAPHPHLISSSQETMSFPGAVLGFVGFEGG